MYAYLRCYLEIYDRILQYERPSIGYNIANIYTCMITCLGNSVVSPRWSLNLIIINLLSYSAFAVLSIEPQRALEYWVLLVSVFPPTSLSQRGLVYNINIYCKKTKYILVFLFLFTCFSLESRHRKRKMRRPLTLFFKAAVKF